VPGAMWENISRRLDSEAIQQQEYKPRLSRTSTRWRPALTFLGAASIFWLTLIPTALHGGETATLAPSAALTAPVQWLDPAEEGPIRPGYIDPNRPLPY
jgi:hypothetical protein